MDNNSEIKNLELEKNQSNSTIEEENLSKIIQSQSDQMISLIDISNAHSNENDIIKDKIKLLEENILKLNNEKSELKNLFNLQTLLFILLILIMFGIFYYSKK